MNDAIKLIRSLYVERIERGHCPVCDKEIIPDYVHSKVAWMDMSQHRKITVLICADHPETNL